VGEPPYEIYDYLTINCYVTCPIAIHHQLKTVIKSTFATLNQSTTKILAQLGIPSFGETKITADIAHPIEETVATVKQQILGIPYTIEYEVRAIGELAQKYEETRIIMKELWGQKETKEKRKKKLKRLKDLLEKL